MTTTRMFAPGDRVDRYTIVSLLGEGGMGAVYHANDERLRRDIALKILRSDSAAEPDEDRTERIVREARAVAAIDHPNIVAIYDVGDVALPGDASRTAFLAMELVRGKSLRALIGDAGVPVIDRIRWLREIAEALGAVHAIGLVHRDMKPENVMIRADGRAKVLDFGIAKRAHLPVGGMSTSAAQVLSTLTANAPAAGTPLYMAPEQMLDEPLDGRTDQFAWGVVAYELLAGESPWGKDPDAVKLVAAILSKEATLLDERALGLPSGTAEIVARALAKSPAARFATMGELISRLDVPSTMMAPATTGQPLPTRTIVRSPKRSTWLALALLTAMGVAAGALMLSSGHGDRRPATAVAAFGTLPSSAVPMRPMDFPAPKTASTEALVEYRAVLRDEYDGRQLSQDGLRRALALDPNFAAASLRLAFRLDRPSSSKAYAEAVRHREDLDDRDRALLVAYEPCVVPEIADYVECERRLAALHVERPMDLEVLEQLAWLQSRWTSGGGVAAYEELIRLDPTMPFAEWRLGRSLELLGRFDEATRHYQRCIELSPLASGCITSKGRVDARGGRCDLFAQSVRRVMVFDSHAGSTRLWHLNAVLTTDAARATVDAALQPLLEDEPRFVFQWQGSVAFWFGEMASAFEYLAKSEAAARASGPSGVWSYYDQLVAAEELGDEAKVRSHVRAFVAARAMNSTPARDEGRLRAMREHKIFPEPEIAALRERWRRDAQTEGMSAWNRWRAYDGVWASSVDEARAALAMDAAQPVPPGLGTDAQAELGHLFLLAGRPADAIPYLEEASLSYQPFLGWTTDSFVTFIMRAAYDLGRAREALGQRAEACDAYARLMRRWGTAKPRPITAEQAHVRMTTLGCR